MNCGAGGFSPAVLPRPSGKQLNEPNPRAELVAALTRRLKTICAEWPEQEFQEMVEHLADITMKYEGRISSVYDRRTADRLVTELNEALERSRAVKDKLLGPDSGTVSAIVLAVHEMLGALSTRPI